MDLPRRRSVLVRMTEDGRRLGTAKIDNSSQELDNGPALSEELVLQRSRPRTDRAAEVATSQRTA